jgi:hypothetical protein
MKKIFLLSILLFTISISAQKKTDSILFDTFEDRDGADVKTLDEKIDNFARKLNSEPQSTKGYIVNYVEAAARTPKQLSESRGVAYAGQVKKNINRIFNFPKWRTMFAFGGLNRTSKGSIVFDSAKIEFWLIPQGAELPENHAEDDGDWWFMSCACPTISLAGNKNIYDLKEPVTFSVEINGGSQDEVVYKWSLSDGKIISGQGTKEIKINLKNVKSEKIIVKVEIQGLCDSCPTEDEETITIQ